MNVYGSNSREVTTEVLQKVLEAIAKVNRRAAKIGVPEFVVTVSAPWFKEIKIEGHALSTKVEMVTVTIIGDPVKLPGGWDLEGSIDFEDGLVLLNGRPGGLQIPERFRHATPSCDHCGLDRRRHSVVLFANPQGQWRQVGHSCIKDYFSTSPERALWAASAYSSIFEDIDSMSGGPRGALYLDPVEVLAVTSRIVDKLGFLSKGKADEIAMNSDRGAVPTSGYVSTYLFGHSKEASDFRSEIGDVTPADTEKALAIVAWARGYFSEDDASDYVRNVALVIGREAFHERRLGLVVSVISAYRRENERQAEKARRVNAHVGTVGERREFVAKYLSCNSFETQFGVMFIGSFDSAEGTLVYKGGSPFWSSDLKQGDEIKFVGTVKEHGEYKGWAQTYVSRCVVGGKVPAPKKAKRIERELEAA